MCAVLSVYAATSWEQEGSLLAPVSMLQGVPAHLEASSPLPLPKGQVQAQRLVKQSCLPSLHLLMEADAGAYFNKRSFVVLRPTASH